MEGLTTATQPFRPVWVIRQRLLLYPLRQYALQHLRRICTYKYFMIPPSTVIVSSLILDAVDRVVINLRRRDLPSVMLGVSSSTCIILGKFSSFSPNPKGLPRDLRAPVLRHTAHLGFHCTQFCTPRFIPA